LSLESHLGCTVFFYSAQDTFDVLTQDCMLEVLEPLLRYNFYNFPKADTGLDLGFWIRVNFKVRVLLLVFKVSG